MENNKKLNPTAWHRYKGRSVVVFDNVFTPEEVDAFASMILTLPYERSQSFDNELNARMEREFYDSLPSFPEALETIKDEFYAEMSEAQSPQKMSHVYAAALRYGDNTRMHTDVACNDCITFLYYGNHHWDSAWGGETIFFDDERSAMFAVSPKPGRLVLFNAGLYHRTGIPMRDCPSTRYGMSVFYRCDHQLNAIQKK